ncbi:hypothetical protein BFP97_16570 [Roseivirga sp. 4D4]|uniref:DUF2911 domain-containing protein n=1 Tax=Roseivirga sp. 4D4 TaxID=1889784 RepID=UPI000853DE41|nr:DUF2911 domain-containing protein [Roseivirga sp. 4D4]OEK03036.1 hypothetical protein BFP97_16570 [Roseivirga sp. 4D4]
MKKINLLLLSLLAVTLIACGNNKKQKEAEADHDHATAQTTSPGKSKSPASQAMTNIGDTHVHIEYHAPSVRGRQIFGGLVAYNEVWVTGAHSATSINFPNDVSLNGNKVPKGKYAFFTIPGESEWTIIINENYEQHLADDYDQELDVTRFTVKPEKLAETQEQLLYEVKPTGDKEGTISISWADVKVSFNVKEL